MAAGTASLFGSLIVSADRASTLMALIAAFLSASLVVLLTVGTYSRKEHVAGYLAPSAGFVRTYSPRVGAITHVDVVEGERVNAGDPLFSVSAPRETSSGVDVDQVHIDRLREEQRSIESQIEGEQALAAERRTTTSHRIAALERELASIDAQRATALHLVELLNRDTSRLEALQKTGHVAASLVDAREGEALRAQESSQLLERESDRVESEIESVRSTLVQIPLQLSVRIDELKSRLLSMERESAEAEAQKSVVVRARVAGRVAAVTAHVGMAVTPDRQILSIIPSGDELQAELLLPTRAAGFVKQGQEVRLRYDAFPYQKFGLYRGKVSSISRTVLNPEDQIGPVRLQVPAYRVVAQLESQTVRVYGNRLHLQPGLTLQADVIRDRRRIIEWIFDPLIAAAMRI